VSLAQAWQFTGWHFGESICLEALLAAGGEPAQRTMQLIGGWIAAHRHLDPPVHLAPGIPLLQIAALRPRDREPMLSAALAAAQGLMALPRGRHGAALHRPDLAPWHSHVWVDCMQLDGPFLARLGVETGREELIDAGIDAALTHAAVLQGPLGLFSHGFDDAQGAANSIHWARGQGWALLGLVGTLTALRGEARRGRAELLERLLALVAALAATTDHGRWHTVVEVEATPMEASLSAFVALGIGRARRAALIGREYDALVAQARQAAHRAVVKATGAFEVSDATPVSSSVNDYAARATGVFPWGQGPFILMELEHVAPP
jgi:unsaturated rhamnogalacturonyl hydrolase